MEIRYVHKKILEKMISRRIPCEYGRTELVFPEADENEVLWGKISAVHDSYLFNEGVVMAYVIHWSEEDGIQLKKLEIGVEYTCPNGIVGFWPEEPVGKQPEWKGGVGVFVLREDAERNSTIELKPFRYYNRPVIARMIQIFAKDLIEECRRNVRTKDRSPLLRLVLDPSITTERNGVEIEIGVQHLEDVPWEMLNDGIAKGVKNAYAFSGERADDLLKTIQVIRQGEVVDRADELLKTIQVIREGEVVDSIFAPTVGEQLMFDFREGYEVPSTVCYFYHGGKRIRIGLILDDISEYATKRIQNAADEMVKQIKSL